MDVSTVFHEVLHAIENSQLNYAITKTPFSANIAIKRSFVQFYDDTPKNEKQIKVKNDPSEENYNLKEELKLVINQKETLESLFETENKKVKALESELDQLKETVKKEKSLSNSNFKMQKAEINELSKTVKNLEEKL